MQKPEINKMLTIGTAHISEETAKRLNNNDIVGLAVYLKDVYGWIIYDTIETEDEEGVPEDLMRLLWYMRSLDCAVLCLDGDGPEIPFLPKYEWINEDEDVWKLPEV